VAVEEYIIEDVEVVLQSLDVARFPEIPGAVISK
jgi:hypothetical protein